MSQKSSLQLTPSGRKRKALELKNQPKMFNFLVSSSDPPSKSRESKKSAEVSSTNSKFDEKKHGYLFEASPEGSPRRNQKCKQQVIRIDSDMSDVDISSTDSPIFPKKAVRVAKKPLAPYKVTVNTAKSDDSDNSNPGSLNKKQKGCQVRNPLKEKKNFSSFNITSKTEGTVTKFSSHYNEDSDVSSNSRKKRFVLHSADSRDSQIDIPSSIALKASPKRKLPKLSQDDREAKRKREIPENRSGSVARSTSSPLFSSLETSKNIENSAHSFPQELVSMSVAKNKEDLHQSFKTGQLPLKKHIVLKSVLNVRNGNTSQMDTVAFPLKVFADHEQVKQAARTAYIETHKDLETLLDMQLNHIVGFDLKQAVDCDRSVLANRYHVNFGFFMQREDYEGAIGSLRSVSRNHYPNKQDLHTVLYKVIEKTNEEGVIQGAQELLYKVLSLHPSIDPMMRQYYAFLLSSRPNEEDVSAPWENLVNLLEEVLLNCEADIEASTKRIPSPFERKKAVLEFIVQLLYEDFCCWVSVTRDHAASLRTGNDLPLIANVLWPRSTIPVLNSNCRELIKLHINAVESTQPDHIFYTQPLVKMLAAINQLADLSLPLTFRKPNEHMVNLAREIVNLAADSATASRSHFFSSFGSRELQLLLPLIVLNILSPTTKILNPNDVSLKTLVQVYLKMDEDTELGKVIEKFKKEPVEFKTTFLSALSAYVDLFGCLKAWQSLMCQARCPSMTNQMIHNSDFTFPVDMFSTSFTIEDFIEDLRQANCLFKKSSVTKNMAKMSLYSSLSMYIG